MEDNNTWVALVSVITSGLIALASMIVPPVIEWAKIKGQTKKEENEKIDKATTNLLDQLVGFKNDDLLEFKTSEEERIINFLSCFYSWQRAVSPRLDRPDNLTINNLQEEFEKNHLPIYLQENYHTMSSMIITITHSALSRR